MYSLDYFKTHPLRIAKSQRHLTVGEILQQEKATVHSESIHPTIGAFIHYGGVELADRLVIVKPPASQDELRVLTEAWYASCGVTLKQLLFYVWRICPREARHGNLAKCDKAFKGWGHGQPEALMAPAIDLVRGISDKKNKFNILLEASGHVNAGCYYDALERQFRYGGWSGAFGGKKWAAIALEFKRYLDGDASAMIAADRCWTLVHNTGPIFNKGFYFDYHDSNLLKVLEAQAKTSVFTLGHLFWDKQDYHHPVVDAFKVFAAQAEVLLKRADPAFDLWAKPTAAATAPNSGAAPAAKGGATITLGTFSMTTGERNSAHD